MIANVLAVSSWRDAECGHERKPAKTMLVGQTGVGRARLQLPAPLRSAGHGS